MTPERGKTWFRWYRKTEMSDLWTRPPLYLKVWAWLLANVDLDAGELTCTYEHIADRVQWEDKGHPHIPSRRIIHAILHWMASNSMLSITTLGEGNRKYTKVSITLWLTYQYKKTDDRNRNETEKSLSFKNKEETTTEPSLGKELSSPFQIWAEQAVDQMLRGPKATRAARRKKAIDTVMRVLTEDMAGDPDPTGRLGKIIKFARQDDFWKKYLKCLSVLRAIGKNGGMRWENIEDSMKTAHNQVGQNNGKPSARQVADEIMEKSARLEKEQGELLARRRQEAGL